MALQKEQINAFLKLLRERTDKDFPKTIGENINLAEIENDLETEGCIKTANYRSIKEWNYYPYLKNIAKVLNISFQIIDNKIVLCQN